jgi:hypothetical protein
VPKEWLAPIALAERDLSDGRFLWREWSVDYWSGCASWRARAARMPNAAWNPLSDTRLTCMSQAMQQELDRLRDELAFLQAEYVNLPREEQQRRRADGIARSAAIADELSLDLDPKTLAIVDHAEFDRAHTSMIEFDRVGR